jgi:hypothetical protein
MRSPRCENSNTVGRIRNGCQATGQSLVGMDAVPGPEQGRHIGGTIWTGLLPAPPSQSISAVWNEWPCCFSNDFPFAAATRERHSEQRRETKYIAAQLSEIEYRTLACSTRSAAVDGERELKLESYLFPT